MKIINPKPITTMTLTNLISQLKDELFVEACEWQDDTNRWSKPKSWHVTMAWCMKRRMSTKADAVCGYYQPCDTEGKHYNDTIE